MLFGEGLPLEGSLSALKGRSLYRSLCPIDEVRGKWAFAGGRRLLHFSSNDYFGLSQHPEVVEAACRYARRYGVGSGSSRLVAGNLRLHEALERTIAEWKGASSCLLFSSGMLANLGALGALGALSRSESGPNKVVFLFDEFVHASLIDGVLLAASHNRGATWNRFKHNDLGHLESLLERHKNSTRVVVSESVFSMEGDLAPVAALAKLCRRTGSVLLVDEAHSNGVLTGDLGRFLRDARDDLLVMGTFGKALGGMGAYVLCSERLREWLVNKARSVIYTTALPPSVVGAASKAIDLVRANPDWGERLLRLSCLLQNELQQSGIPFIGGGSQIVSVLTRTEERTKKLTKFLREKGFFVVGIRPPTVPKNRSRIRLSVTRLLTEEDVCSVVAAIRSFAPGLGWDMP